MMIMAVAAAVQGSIGFGSGLLAAPLLMLIDPGFVPAPLLAANLVLTVLVAQREWSAVDFAALRFIVGGRLVGTLLAAAFLARFSGASFDILFGVMVLIAVMLTAVRGARVSSSRNLAVAGVASGLMGTISSIGGPPVALAYQEADPARFRATLGVHLVVGASLSLLAIWAVGRIGATELALAAVLIPGALAGFLLSGFGVGILDAKHLRLAILGLSTVSALVVLWRAIGAGF